MPFPTSVWFAFAKVATARTCSTPFCKVNAIGTTNPVPLQQ